jgi:hypothetical protein
MVLRSRQRPGASAAHLVAGLDVGLALLYRTVPRVALIRANRGRDIAAACGQLANVDKRAS